MNIKTAHPKLWEYLSETQKDLLLEGDYLMHKVIPHTKHSFKDYSFLVFPYAKAYEGFLKQLFLDIHFISHLDYISDHFRLGKFLSPHLVDRLEDRSLFGQIEKHSTKDLASRIWQAWKLGRNQIFHYYPHNIKAVSFAEAGEIVEQMLNVMVESYEKLQFLHKTS